MMFALVELMGCFGRFLVCGFALVALGSACGGETSSESQACSTAAPICVMACGADVAARPVCRHGAWACPSGYVSMDSCPKDMCFDPWDICCDAQGNPHSATCPDHGAPVCAPGQTLGDGGVCPKVPGCEQTGCAAGQYCHFDDTSCGAGVAGKCKPRPTSCPATDAPVCGCDGKIYPNECGAALAGVALGTSCTIPADRTLCGPRLCKLGAEYCQVTVQSGLPHDVFDCMPTPAGCGSMPDCACLASEPCGSKCSDGSKPGWVKLSCP